VAVVELAQSSGLPLMGALDAMGATSRGLGEVIRAALDAGAQSLVIGLGGSASTDAGAGALAALGLRLGVADGGGALTALDAIDRSALRAPPPGGVILLTDVAAPLLGPTGAAAVFGPQKGASPAQVAELDAALSRFAECLGGDPTAPGSGAAGGTAFGFAAAWGADIRPGHAYLAELSGLRAALERADVLLTGEGRFDAQSLGGKVVGELIAAAQGKTIGVIAGQVTAESGTWTASLSELAGSADAAMADPARWLRRAGELAAEDLGGR
jgi:glycerate kinase